jgi:hypothetical protein
MTDSAFTFLSWARRGLATAVATSDDTTTKADVSVEFNAGALATASGFKLELIGPGDIVGLDPNVIVRAWPPPDDLDAEFVSYPLIEFDQADLLWRYSPDPSPDASTQVRPWLALVVLKSSEGTLAPPTADQPLAVLTVNDVAALPPQSELWAWGHTQVEGASVDPADEQGLRGRISGEPGLFSGRLMSPRILESNTEYVACLVPAFERGRKVGLGELTSEDTTPVLAQWDLGASPFALPVYHAWRFRTGTLGNFEHAARLIKPVVLPESTGRRDMDVADLEFDLGDASSGSLPAEGALMSVAAFDAGPPDWPASERDPFIARLSTLLNAPSVITDPEAGSTEDPELVPPLYGQWYAATDRLTSPLPAGSNPAWFYDLNSDPRSRVAAALGTKVIQRESQAILASGWNQVSEIRTVNDALRVLQLTRGLLQSIYTRHYTTQSSQRFFHLTRMLHDWVTCDGATVCTELKASRILPGFMSAQWLRLARSRGPVGRLQGRPGLTNFVPNLMDQFNDCKVPVPKQPIPPGLHEPHDGDRIPCEFIDDLEGAGPSVTLFWGLLILWVIRKLMVTQNGDCYWLALKALRYAIVLIRISINAGDVRRRCKWFDRTLTIQDILNAPTMPGLTVQPILTNPPPMPLTPGGAPDSIDAAAVRAALVRLLEALALPAPLTCRPEFDADGNCKTALVESLRPELTVGRRLLERLTPLFAWNPADSLQPLFAAPAFERPMYLPLSEISFDWILPGLNDMKRDSVGVAVTNQRFVEAYMVGLNHEMTRELLWNEFPTDQRGTYFRQFWDIAGCVLDGSTTPPDQFRDVHPLRLWNKLKGLGEHSPRTAGGGTSAFLVLVVRAQLIRKYPNVIVYMQRRNAASNRLTGEQKHPVFYALLQPDVAFYGFDITVDQIRNDTATDDWYFVLQEQPGDPKFADETVPHDGTVPYSSAATFGASAGVIAQETFLDPFRIGFQARSMLPEEP